MAIVEFPGGQETPVQEEPPKRKRASRTKHELVALRRELWEDRIAGKTYEQIAKERDMPLRTVIYNCQAAVSELDATAYMDEQMAVSLAQLREIQRIRWKLVIMGDPDATKDWFSAHDRIMKLLGLEAPKRVDVYAEIHAWAEREGLDPQDVIDVTATLLPVPKPPSYSTG